MTLADLRKFSVRSGVKIHFRIEGGVECTVNEHGVVQVPALRSIPEFNVEREIASVEQFLLESAGERAGKPAPRETVGRERLASLVAASPHAAAASADDE